MFDYLKKYDDMGAYYIGLDDETAEMAAQSLCGEMGFYFMTRGERHALYGRKGDERAFFIIFEGNVEPYSALLIKCLISEKEEVFKCIDGAIEDFCDGWGAPKWTADECPDELRLEMGEDFNDFEAILHRAGLLRSVQRLREGKVITADYLWQYEDMRAYLFILDEENALDAIEKLRLSMGFYLDERKKDGFHDYFFYKREGDERAFMYAANDDVCGIFHHNYKVFHVGIKCLISEKDRILELIGECLGRSRLSDDYVSRKYRVGKGEYPDWLRFRVGRNNPFEYYMGSNGLI